MKITYLLLVLFLWTPFCAKAQKKPFIIEKQLEVIKKEPENSNALKFLCQYYLNKGEFSKTITYAEYMKNIADKSKNPFFFFFFFFFFGFVFLMSGWVLVVFKMLPISIQIIIVPFNGCIRVSRWHNKINIKSNTLSY